MTPFEKLVQLCPVFELANKTNVTRQIDLRENDSMLAMPLATVKIRSYLLINMPDRSIFRVIKPTHEQLEEAGMLTKNDDVVIGEPDVKLGNKSARDNTSNVNTETK